VTESFRLLAVHAHPDDESSKGAATMAHYRSQGVRVHVVSCTGGERGDVLNPKLAHDPDVLRDLPGFRRHEMEKAAGILDIEHTWLGFVDSGLPQGDPPPPLPAGCFALEPIDVTTEALVRVIREFRPHVVTTYDEKGGYPHPDHIMCHRVAFEAFHAAGDPERYAGHGEPWRPLKLYYNHDFSMRRVRTMHEALIDEGLLSPFGDWVESRAAREIPERPVTTRIRAEDFFDARDAALRAHETQIDPDGFFFAMPRELEATVWPYEEFELAESLVPTTTPEDDLFAGIHPEDTP